MAKKKRVNKKKYNFRGRSKENEKETLRLLENYIAMKDAEKYLTAALKYEAKPTVRISRAKAPYVLIETMNEFDYIHHPRANLVKRKKKK